MKERGEWCRPALAEIRRSPFQTTRRSAQRPRDLAPTSLGVENGTSRLVPLGGSTDAAGAKRAGIQGSLTAVVGTPYEPELRALLQASAEA